MRTFFHEHTPRRISVFGTRFLGNEQQARAYVTRILTTQRSLTPLGFGRVLAPEVAVLFLSLRNSSVLLSCFVPLSGPFKISI